MKKIIFGSSSMITGMILFHAYISAAVSGTYVDTTVVIVLFFLSIILSLFGFILGITGLLEKDEKK